MRVALFAAGGDIPVAALRALAAISDIAVLVRPGPRPTLRSRLRHAIQGMRPRNPPDELARLAADHAIPVHRTRGPDDTTLAPYLRSLNLDVVCVATFPWRLRPDVLESAHHGALNVHPSLLPRHRGSNPWFWTYHADDREVGVTIHRCDHTVDTGPILRQQAWPLSRGYPVATLHADVASRGAALLANAAVATVRGEARAVPQDEGIATHAGRVKPGIPMVDPGWPTERTWHFLAGLAGQYAEPLACAGKPVPYNRVPAFEIAAPLASPGTVEVLRDGEAWRLWCHDGFVRLERHSG